MQSSKKKQAFYKAKFQNRKCDIKGTWHLINSLLEKWRKSNGITLLIDGSKVNKLHLSCKSIYQSFSTAAEKLVDFSPQVTLLSLNILSVPFLPSMYVWPTCLLKTSNILLKMKNKLRAGIDLVPTKILKSLSDKILVALSHVFNLSLRWIHNGFKIAKTCCVFKKGNANDIKNYRLINLLSNISKILEKIMYRRLFFFLHQHHFFFHQQFGFRKNYSTSHALSFQTYKIAESLANKTPTLGVFLDLSKGFDAIDHRIFLSKLEHYGIQKRSQSDQNAENGNTTVEVLPRLSYALK